MSQYTSPFSLLGLALCMLLPGHMFAQTGCIWSQAPSFQADGITPTADWCHQCCADGIAQHAYCSTCCGAGSSYYANLMCIQPTNNHCHPAMDTTSSVSCCATDAAASCVGIPLALLSKSTTIMQAKTINCTAYASTKHYCMRGYRYVKGLCVWPENAGLPTLYCQAAETLTGADLPPCYDPKRWEGQQPRKLTHANNAACPYDTNGKIVAASTAKSQSETQQSSTKTDNKQKERGETRRINRRFQRRHEYYEQQ